MQLVETQSFGFGIITIVAAHITTGIYRAGALARVPPHEPKRHGCRRYHSHHEWRIGTARQTSQVSGRLSPIAHGRRGLATHGDTDVHMFKKKLIELSLQITGSAFEAQDRGCRALLGARGISPKSQSRF